MKSCVSVPASCFAVVFSCLAFSTPATAQQSLQTLTDTASGIHLDEWKQMGDGWSIRKRTLHGGKQEGIDLITVDNGVFEIDIVPTRGMSIYEIRYGDVRIGWDAPVESLVHPSLVDLESRGGIGWLEGFNEWMVRCGLEFAGHPGHDEAVDRDLTLHGKIGNIPASQVQVLVSKAPTTEIRIRGIVHESFFNGPRLKLRADLVIRPGEAGFRIEDTVSNRGGQEQEFQIIYHANFGTPLLEEGSRVYAAASSIAPMDDHAAKSINRYSIYEAPQPGFQEQVYLAEPLADEAGRTTAVLVNAKQDLAVSLQWPVQQLPYLTIWKNTAAKKDGYVTGIEPATGYPYNRSVERQAGRVPTLPPGGTREFHLDVAIHDGASEVKAALESVSKIQATRQTKFSRQPLH